MAQSGKKNGSRKIVSAAPLPADQKPGTPAVSIVVPVYNAAPFLAACLDSVLAQTFRDFECICVDDGSTDATPQILARYAQNDARIRVVTQANKGVSVARNTGVSHAKGAFICFIDADDFIHPQMMEAMHSRMEQALADMAVCGFELVSGARDFTPLDLSHLEWQTITSPVDAFFCRKPRIPGEATGKLFRREILARHAFVEGVIFSEDVVFMTCLLRDVKTVVWTKQVFNYYRVVATSATKSAFNNRKALSYLEGIRLMHDFYRMEGNLHVQHRVRRTVIKNSVKSLLNAVVRKCPDDAESLRLFELIQPRIRDMKTAGMVTYQGLKLRHKLVLFLLVNFPHARYAFKVGKFLLRSRRRIRA